jgi:hypothetical protein
MQGELARIQGLAKKQLQPCHGNGLEVLANTPSGIRTRNLLNLSPLHLAYLVQIAKLTLINGFQTS